MIGRLAALARRRPEVLGLAGFLLVGIALLVIAKLGSEIGEGEVPAFDAALLRAARGSFLGGKGPTAVMLGLTAIGNNVTLIVLVAAVSGYFAAGRRWTTALYLVAATSLGGLMTTALKAFFQRGRPDVVEHLVATNSASFPSGHAMNSAVVFLTIAVVLAREAERRAQRAYLLVVALLLVILIGASRVVAGVHWPTDVLAGWIVGAAWAITCALLMAAARGRRTLRHAGTLGKAIPGATSTQSGRG